jgi:hypothetical protein
LTVIAQQNRGFADRHMRQSAHEVRQGPIEWKAPMKTTRPPRHSPFASPSGEIRVDQPDRPASFEFDSPSTPSSNMVTG